MLIRRLAIALALASLAPGQPTECEAAKRQAARPSVTIVAVGDVQLGRGVGQAIARHGIDYPFARVRRLICSADLALANLECALSRDGVPISKRFSFKADPAAADGLRHAGFGVAILANNHSLDCGREALPESLNALRTCGLLSVGAGRDAPEAAAPLLIERNGLRIAILARTFILPEGIIYREDAPTVAVYDPNRINGEVHAARQQSDIVIVSLHWGIEYARQPQEEQRRIAHRLIDAGASLVLGHHPHTPQPVERYHHGLIAYSLGNFVFDPAGDGGRHGLLLRCILTRKGVASYSGTPVLIRDAQPGPASHSGEG